MFLCILESVHLFIYWLLQTVFFFLIMFRLYVCSGSEHTQSKVHWYRENYPSTKTSNFAVLWNHIIPWVLNLVVWRRWLCSWSLEFCGFRIILNITKVNKLKYSVRILKSWSLMTTKYTKLNVQQIFMSNK